jgi:hypothetical protein
VLANDATTRAVTQNGADSQRSRASLVALWLTQVALALAFLMAGAASAPARSRGGWMEPSPSASDVLSKTSGFSGGPSDDR